MQIIPKTPGKWSAEIDDQGWYYSQTKQRSEEFNAEASTSAKVRADAKKIPRHEQEAEGCKYKICSFSADKDTCIVFPNITEI